MWKTVLRATCEISKEGRCDWLAMSATGTEMMLCNIYQVFIILELFSLNCHSRSSIQWLVTLFPHILSSLLLHWHLCIILCFPFTAWYIFITLSYPLQHSCLENPVHSGAWWAAVHRAAQSRTWLKWLACMHALEKEMAPHSSILAWRIPGTEEPGGLLSMGSHRVRHDWSDLAAAAVGLLILGGGKGHV